MAACSPARGRGKVVLLGIFPAGGDWLGAVRHVLPMLAFFVGVTSLKQSRTRPWVRRMRRR
jgi:uncharacterized membrane protein YoaK (UPF0700 family)